MESHEVFRSVAAIKNRIATFKREYKLKRPKSGEEPPDCIYFDHLERILGSSPKNMTELGDDSLQILENIDEDTYYQCDNNNSFDLQVEILDSGFADSLESVAAVDNILENPSTSKEVSDTDLKSTKSKKRLRESEKLVEMANKTTRMMERVAAIEEERWDMEKKQAELNQAVNVALLDYLKKKTENMSK